jgi:hypothetical protein
LNFRLAPLAYITAKPLLNFHDWRFAAELASLLIRDSGEVSAVLTHSVDGRLPEYCLAQGKWDAHAAQGS